MEDKPDGLTASQKATAELNRVVATVSAEISARKSGPNDATTLKRNRRFAKAKAARVSEAGGIASAAARELAAAKSRVLDKVAQAEAAGFTVQDDFSVIDARAGVGDRTTDAAQFAAGIQAQVAALVALDEQVASRLYDAANELKDFND